MSTTVLINGHRRTKLDVSDRLVQFGDGVFETCIVKKGQLLFWQAHFSRLTKGAQTLKINLVDEKLWINDISKALRISKLDQAVVKIILSRGQSQRGYGFDSSIQPTRVVIVSPMPKNLPNAYQLSTCQSGYSINQNLANIKHCNRLEQILARTNMSTNECLMLDDSDSVISVTQGNIYAIKDSVLLTPSLAECGISGTRRSVVLSLAKDLGLTLNIGRLTLQDLYAADEVFITNSVIGIKPVDKIHEKSFTQHTQTQRLIKAYDQQSLKKKNLLLLKPKKRFVKWFATLIVIISVLIYYWGSSVKTTQSLVYHLPKGATIYSTAQTLDQQGLINSKTFMIVVAKLLGVDTKLKSGYYDVTTDMSVVELLKDFSDAKIAQRNVVLIEGKTIQDYYQQLNDMDVLTSNGSFKKTMQVANIDAPYEGYFWPDTYRINYGDSVASVLSRAHKKMQEKLHLLWQQRDPNLKLGTVHEALVLASLIEKETAHHQEKARISGVFMNRLQKNMRLQTDPSVIYALGDQYQGRLSKQDLKHSSPYNTYRNHGLPPGAIGSVGEHSLRAAFHPEQVDDLYFVSKKDGSHAFSKTYKEHKIKIKKYLK